MSIELNEVISVLARMREPMLKDHPEHLSGSVSDVLECALNLEAYQAELIEQRDLLIKATNELQMAMKNLETYLGTEKYEYLFGRKT